MDYAGEIYDLGLEKGVNPEFIYIIARKETSFRNTSSNTDHYNYYGYAHTNESSHGAYFNSFMEGVETLMDWILEKGTFDAVVRSYSYLGDYLYNFDPEKESGTGGCYYLELIYGDNYSRCDDSYYCSPSNKTNCVLTTEEEKEAYIGWQHDQYILHREAIFKLGAQVCTGSEISTDPSLEVATSQLKEPLRDFLSSKGLSIEDLNTAILYNNLANPITLSYINSNIKTDYTITDTSSPITYDGTLLPKCNVSLDDIGCKFSFDVLITNNMDEKYKCTVFIDVPLTTQDKSIENGSVAVKDDVNLSFYRYE